MWTKAERGVYSEVVTKNGLWEYDTDSKVGSQTSRQIDRVRSMRYGPKPRPAFLHRRSARLIFGDRLVHRLLNQARNAADFC